MPEPDESRLWKYLELPQVFQMKAGEIDITSKQHLRTCEKLAAHVARQRPKTPKEFEQNEYLKNFVMRSAELNEKTIELLEYLKTTVQEVCNDYKALKDGANLNRIMRDQSEKILKLIEERDEYLHKYYELRKTVSRENTPAS
jgi:hypothetical protein